LDFGGTKILSKTCRLHLVPGNIFKKKKKVLHRML